MSYFDLMGSLGMEFLHPTGKAGTNLLIDELKPTNGMKILEVGCGTGATAVYINKRFKPHLVATDVSDGMLKAARQRALINFGLGKLEFVKIKPDGRLPFADNSFDAAYSESVIGISGEKCIPVLMSEMARVLKPGGRLVTNDAIWNENAERDEIRYLVDLGLRDFGFSVSSAFPAYLHEWQAAYESAGLKVIKAQSLNTITPDDNYDRRSIYTYYRKLISKISPSVRKQKRFFDQWENKHHRTEISLLDAYLFVLENVK
jgi:ubiquinone/menaquinone biosynthesis C-methylase UbiE